LNVLLRDNAITQNDQWADEDLFKVPNERDIVFVNGTGGGLANGLLNLGMSNNAISINPAVSDVQSFFNFGAQPNFRIALDGVTNGFSANDVIADRTVGALYEFPIPWDDFDAGPPPSIFYAIDEAYFEFLGEGFPLMPPPF
jgi:hypothetical protein